MQTIIPAIKNVMDIIGKPKTSDNDDYRFIHYVVSLEVDDGVLLLNTLTGELLFLTHEEYEKANTISKLREKWFVVPTSLPDKVYVDRVRFVLKTIEKKPEHRDSFTIFTTTDCNARCFYCYEAGCHKKNMSEETAYKVADYIIKESHDEKVFLSWFGGEPLYNMEVIDIICTKLKECGIEYESTMISNGYLFDEEVIKKASELWKLSFVQITLDGTKEAYNRIKAYIYKDGINPYNKVMGNIKGLLDSGISVTIRMNVDGQNTEELMKLADELKKRFKNRISVYSHPLFEFSGLKEKRRTAEERKHVYLQQQLIRNKLKENGLYHARSLPKKFPIRICMADSGYSLTILPDGELGLCGKYLEDGFVGNLDSKELKQDVLEHFRETRETIEECNNCFYYPYCIRLKMCKEEKECFPESQEELLQMLKDSMLTVYNSWLNKKEVEKEEKYINC